MPQFRKVTPYDPAVVGPFAIRFKQALLKSGWAESDIKASKLDPLCGALNTTGMKPLRDEARKITENGRYPVFTLVLQAIDELNKDKKMPVLEPPRNRIAHLVRV